MLYLNAGSSVHETNKERELWMYGDSPLPDRVCAVSESETQTQHAAFAWMACVACHRLGNVWQRLGNVWQPGDGQWRHTNLELVPV